MTLADHGRWRAEIEQFHSRIGPRFARAEPRRRARLYLLGLGAGGDRTNGWTMADRAGDVSPDGMQRLLRRADWDVDGVRDDVRQYVIEHLAGSPGVLMVDEIGFAKKGVRSAGVAPQLTSMTGRVENCQVGIFLAYRSHRGHALVDRELYLPRSWTADLLRRRAAGVSDEIAYVTKEEIANIMLSRALAVGVSAAWVTATEPCSRSGLLRRWLRERGQPYATAVRRESTAITGPWSRLSPGYSWARTPIDAAGRRDRAQWLLGRRVEETGELAHYLCYGPPTTRLLDLAQVVDGHRTIHTCLRQAGEAAGLGAYQARHWRAWYAHITLSMVASACLVAARRPE
jgi:SRSO17 transposase